MFNLLIPVLSGTAAGVVNGFIGTGGGIILIFVLSKLMGKSNTKDTFATVIAAILPMSAVSAISYYNQGNVPLGKTAVYIVPAVIGGVIGAIWLDKIKVNWLKLIFCGLVVYAGIKMTVS